MRIPQISIVIVTYQSRDTIAASLSTLALAHANGLIECIVVDNDSHDGTAEFVRERFPWVRVTGNDANPSVRGDDDMEGMACPAP